MTTLPEKSQQILQAHAALIHGVVMACQNRALLVQLEPVLKMSEENGWSGLIAALRKVINGRRDISVLGGLDEEDRVIVEAVLRGIQDPTTLPDPLAKAEATHAAPGLASMVSAASRGDVPALQALGNMAEQMLPVGGDMARLGGILRRLINGERDPDVLCKGMGGQGRSLVLSILDELAKLNAH